MTRLAARSGPHALTIEHAPRIVPEVAEERLVAVFCEDAFELDTDEAFDVELPSLSEGCTSVELSLTRYGEVADS